MLLSKSKFFHGFLSLVPGFSLISVVMACIVVVQSFSHSVVCDSAFPWTAARHAPLSFTISWSLLKLTSIETVMTSSDLIFCHPLLLLPSIFPSIRDISNESALWIRWPKYWSFRFSISPANEYSGLISFRIDCFDPLAVQVTLRSLLQHHTSESINSSALSLLYGPTLKSIHDYWKNQSFEYMDLCRQSNISAF